MPKPASQADSVGQCLIIGFDGVSMSPGIGALLRRIQPAGVILFARNIVSAEQAFNLLSECQNSVSTPMFTCVDMEGGEVDRLRNVVGPAPSAADVFKTGRRGLHRKHGALIGESCRALGFNTDFAPVVDLALAASQAVMKSRAVSSDPRGVVTYAREFLLGLRSAEVAGAAKHFPGLGEAGLDTHLELPRVNKSWDRLWAEDLYPYRVMTRELPMVMVGHASYPEISGDEYPASLSKKWISDILRQKLRYSGLVVSDDLEMGGVRKTGTVDHAAVSHIRAGGDLCLICHKEENIMASHEALLREAERDTGFAELITMAASRVGAFQGKRTHLKNSPVPPTPAKLEKLSRKLHDFNQQVHRAGTQERP